MLIQAQSRLVQCNNFRNVYFSKHPRFLKPTTTDTYLTDVFTVHYVRGGGDACWADCVDVPAYLLHGCFHTLRASTLRAK